MSTGDAIWKVAKWYVLILVGLLVLAALLGWLSKSKSSTTTAASDMFPGPATPTDAPAPTRSFLAADPQWTSQAIGGAPTGGY